MFGARGYECAVDCVQLGRRRKGLGNGNPTDSQSSDPQLADAEVRGFP